MWDVSRFGATAPDLVTVDAATAAVAWERVPFADIPRFQREASARIAGQLTGQGIAAHGPRVTFSRPPGTDSIEIAPGFLVPDTFVPGEGVTLQAIPHGRAAHAVLQAPYEKLGEAWAAFVAWFFAQNLQPAGLSWEVYSDPVAPVTDLYILTR